MSSDKLYTSNVGSEKDVLALEPRFQDYVFQIVDPLTATATIIGYFVDAEGRHVPYTGYDAENVFTGDEGTTSIIFVRDVSLTLTDGNSFSFAELFKTFVESSVVPKVFADFQYPGNAVGFVCNFSDDLYVATSTPMNVESLIDSATDPNAALQDLSSGAYPIMYAGVHCLGRVAPGFREQVCRQLVSAISTGGGGGGGAGTEYTEGDTDATFTGPIVMMEAGSNTATPLKGSATDGLLVNLGANNDVTVTTVSTVTNVGTVGAVTAITNALPTGTNTIGSVKLTDGVDVADILSVGGVKPLAVAVLNSSGVQLSTFPVSIAAGLPTGTNTLGSIKLTDGTDVADVLDLTNSNPLTVAIVDGSGTQITSFSGSGIPTVMAKYVAGTCTGAAATQIAFSGGNTTGRKTVRVSNGSATYYLFVRTTKSPTAIPALVEASSATLILAPYASEVFVCDDTMEITVQNSSGIATSTNWTATEEI